MSKFQDNILKDPLDLPRLISLIDGLNQNHGTLPVNNKALYDRSTSSNNHPLIIAGIVTCLSGGVSGNTLATSNNTVHSPASQEVVLSNSVRSTEEVVHYVNELDKCLSLSPKVTKESLIKEILGFRSLESNWDGYGGYPLGVLCGAKAITLLDYLPKKSLESIDDVFPNPNGTISFMWKNHSGERVSLEIGSEKMSYYVKYNAQKPIFCDELEINKQNIEGLSEYIKTL